MIALRFRSSILLSLLLLGTVLPSAAASAPDWLQALAREPLPTYSAETDGVVLLDEQSTTIKENGEISIVQRYAVKLLRPTARNLGTVIVGFDNETKLTYLAGWSIGTDNRVYEVKEKDAIETAMFSDNTYSDLRHKLLSIPGSEPGAIIGYEYHQRRRPYVLQDTWRFQSSLPVRTARFAVHMPAGWHAETYWNNHSPVSPQCVDNSSCTWEVKNVDAIEDERDMPPLRSIAGMMVANYLSPRQGNVEAHTSWNDVAAWYYGLVASRDQATEPVRAKTQSLIAGLQTPMEKITALAEFVQRDIRYVAVEVGIGGYQPHSAEEVFANRFGDCKDKATLLRAMLRQAGIDADSVAVHTDRDVVRPDIPSFASFNHMIVAIHVAPDTARTPAMIDHKTLGRLLFFDPTAEFTPVGFLPDYLQGSNALLIRNKSGELVQLPLSDPTVNRLVRQAKLELQPDGTLVGVVEEFRSGAVAVGTRARLLRSKLDDRSKIVEDFLSGFLGSFQLTKAAVGDLEKNDRELYLRYEFRAPNYAKNMGGLLLVGPRVLGSKSDSILESKKPRKLPIDLGYPTLQIDRFDIKLPPGFVADELPDPTTAECGGIHYTSKTQIVNGVLHYERKFQREDIRSTPDQFQKLRDFYRTISADERTSAVLKKAE